MLKVIGAGFGRTGTLSLKLALEQLGLGPCYHMVEVFKNPTSIGWWIDAADGNPDWDKIFAGFNATVDWPSVTFYAALAERYRDAKVVLTARDAQDWYRSVTSTIFINDTPPMTDKPFDEMFRKVIARQFDNRMRDHDWVVSVYRRHLAEVRERIPADRLLVYDVKQGWPALCEFLGVPVPEAPFPKTNTTEEFNRHRGLRR